MTSEILTYKEAELKIIEGLPNDIKMLSNFFQLENKKLYLVGGCIRDTFLGKSPKDYDVCTDALPTTVIKILEKFNIKYNLQGEHFAVVVAQMEEGNYEIATFREDISAGTGNNTDDSVRLGVTMKEDCQRRDFTINAMFMDLSERKIIDLVDGRADLEAKLVRCVGNPVLRFKEDNLRKLRCIRFSTRLHFNIEKNTFDAIHNDPDLNISGERVANEFISIVTTTSSYKSLIEILYKTRLINQMFRGLILNDLSEINFSGITSFNSLIASFICTCNTNIADKLVKLQYSSKTASSVEFLLVNIKKDQNTILPLQFFNKRKSTNLIDSEISIYNNETKAIKWLVNFQPDATLSETLMAQGIQGEQLGKTINKHYQDAYLSAIKRMH